MKKTSHLKRPNHPYDERERMELILSTLNTGLVLLDPDLNVVWVNAMIWKMFSDENLIGKKCYAVAENRTEPCDGCRQKRLNAEIFASH